MDKIYTKLKDIRIQQNLTQSELGELCGLMPQFISRYEGGRANLTISNLRKITDALEYDIFLNKK